MKEVGIDKQEDLRPTDRQKQNNIQETDAMRGMAGEIKTKIKQRDACESSDESNR